MSDIDCMRGNNDFTMDNYFIVAEDFAMATDYMMDYNFALANRGFTMPHGNLRWQTTLPCSDYKFSMVGNFMEANVNDYSMVIDAAIELDLPPVTPLNVLIIEDFSMTLSNG